jgi:Fe2+ transport system protein FeoA
MTTSGNKATCSHNANADGDSQSLASLRAHDAARIVAIDGDQDNVERLKALGLCVGRRIELIKAGDPLVVRVIGARVGLSAQLASMVRIEPMASMATAVALSGAVKLVASPTS